VGGEGDREVIEKGMEGARLNPSVPNGANLWAFPIDYRGSGTANLPLLSRVAMEPHLLTCLFPRFGHQRVRLESALVLARLDPPRSESNPWLRDEQEEPVHDDAIVAAAAAVVPASSNDT
jgi:hypothetical protein